MNYSVSDISKYIIYYSNEKNYGITNLRLQKILYFVQMYFMKIRGTCCFGARLVAWDFGPVVPKIFRKYERFGGGQICDYRNPHVTFYNKIDRQIVEGVVDLLSSYTTSNLVEISQNQYPYQHALWNWRREISVRSMKDFIVGQEKES